MAETPVRESAKIYKFPAGGRASLAIRRDGPASVTTLKPASVAGYEIGGGWYHDDAIRLDAEMTRKR